VVVPAIRVVIGNYHGSRFPERALLEGVDDVDDKGLFVGGIGVARMRVLEGRGLQESDGGQIAIVERGKEIVGVVLMVGRVELMTVCLIAAANGRDGTWPGVGEVGSRSVVLEGLMMLDVIQRNAAIA
jgi:hypothetical protein